MTIRAAVLLAVLAPFGLSGPPAAAGDAADGFLPKEDMGVAALRAEVPEADGRGVLVAVLDTGVDLLHPSLAKCPDGSAKVVDFLDATDAGEVPTLAVAVPEGGAVVGLSGRRLALWDGAPPSLRLGLARAEEIYPDGLLGRLREERRQEREKAQRLAAERVPDGVAPPAPPDPGDPMHDLVLYGTEGDWRVRFDADSDGDLAEEPEVREYPVAQDVVTVGGRARLGFGVRVLRGGEAVSLLFDGGGHGTHVAGIIAGFHGEGSPLNGLAPAAKILAVKIGNGRFGGATTHLAVVRGLDFAGRMGADVVNVSFGGGSLFSDGREVAARFLDDAVAKYGYAVCVSAGNAGPAHFTVGAPATARRAYVIGAWCPVSTQRTNYGVVDPTGGCLFPFSSRGPLPGGAAGVSFLAPGAAVSAMPEWGLVSGRNMNGTSMAAPQASGAVAALLSAAKAEKLPLSAARLRRALRASARPEPGLTAVEQGYGHVDALGALRLLREDAGGAERVEWRVDAPGPNGPGGGLLFPAVTGQEPFDAEVRLIPDFAPDVPAETRARFAAILDLATDVPWIAAASPVHAAADGTTVSLRLFPARMGDGMNVGVVRALAAGTAVEEARITVTAIRPRVVGACGVWTREEMRLAPGEARALFLVVPPGATVARLETRESDPAAAARVAFSSSDFLTRQKGLWPEAESLGAAEVRHREVREGTTVEVAVHRPFRAATGSGTVEVAVCFKGLEAGADVVTIPRGRFGSHLNLRAAGGVRGRFEGEAEWIEEPLAFRFESVPDRTAAPLLDGETLYRHRGTATFTGEAGGEVRVDLAFETPFEDYLDDATMEILDANGKVLATGFAWSGPTRFTPPRRGTYTARVTVHDRGRDFFRGGAVFSPVLLRKVGRQGLDFRHDVYEGLVSGGPEGANFDLPDGTRTGAIVLRPGFDGPQALRGTIQFKDERWDTPLLTRPVRIEPRGAPDREAELRTGLTALLSSGVRAALDRDEVAPEERARLETLAAAARAAKVLDGGTEALLLTLAARAGPDAAREALARLEAAKDAVPPPVFARARAEIALAAGGAASDEDLKAFEGDDGEDARRVRFLVARGKGDAVAALAALDRLLEVAPPRPSLTGERFVLLLDLKRFDEARILLSRFTAEFPGREAEVARRAYVLFAAEGK